ncbi:MAG: LPS export ABC transporter permease LptF [Pseudomonadota bacterium]
MNWTLHKYILREIFTPFVLTLGVLTLMLFAGGLLRLVEFLTYRGISPPQVGLLLFYRLPYVLVFTIPMALLLAVFIAFLRLGADSELTALRAAGLSLYQMLPAPLLATLLAFAATLVLSVHGKPAGSLAFKRLLYDVARERMDVAFQEHSFTEAIDKLVVYVNRVPSPGRLEDIFIYDERDPDLPNSVLARRAAVIHDPRRGALVLRLENGTVFRVSPDYKVAEAVRFGRYDMNLDPRGLLGPRQVLAKSPGDMTIADLRAEISRSPDASKRQRLAMEIQRRFALPFACLALGLMAVPLGATSRLERGTGVAFALAVYLLYYLLLTAAWGASEAGTLPFWSVWTPNVAVGGLALLLLYCANRRCGLRAGR